jgi:hypothetical protein
VKRTAALAALAALVALAAGLAGASPGDGDWPAGWSVSEQSLGFGEVRLTLRMRAIRNGGDGEARRDFLQRAAELARAGGYRDYVVLEYVEGIDSNLPLARRYAVGVIRLVP